ncbi:protein O-GlcNAcase isoform X1 [Octopus sinensis]|uniref:protein O-GlcNAcase n=1 Tax=Octopus sinensis TaxID=2607531 RepID=A0A6P7T379_9MOLL|nr:protein O-GlcNAcase isoform X1 [Octopus sinensis]
MTGTDCEDGLMVPNNGNFTCGVVEGFYGRPWTTDQRRILFKWMSKMGLNTYLYAPKDDCKHRAMWRDLYSVEEADCLTGLIDAAHDQNVEFVYALSPGLDITYSSTKDVTALKRKLEQVATFGCTAFALLFDDIDPQLCEADKNIFQSIAAAQVSVTNETYQHLGQLKFLFCPTEYCSARAMPAVSNSEYLSTIGAKLLPDVDVMWTGNKVVSKKITIQTLAEVSKILQRQPVIWDNIHANDYDPRRVFLGPYDGRSPEIIPYVKGVLTNPNCEFEANFIPLHTLAQWCKSNVNGVKKDIIAGDRLSPIASDIKLETEIDFTSDEDIPAKFDTRYQPRAALKVAINEWIKELACSRHSVRLTFPKPIVPLIPSVNTCATVTSPTMTLPTGSMVSPMPVGMVGGVFPNSEVVDNSAASSYMQPVMAPINSLVEPDSVGIDAEVIGDPLCPDTEPMDCFPFVAATTSTTTAFNASTGVAASATVTSPPTATTPPPPPPLSPPSTISTTTITTTTTTSDEGLKSASSSPSDNVMQVDNAVGCTTATTITTATTSNSNCGSSNNNGSHNSGSGTVSCTTSSSSGSFDSADNIEVLSCDDLRQFVELFYMPFEHGECGLQLLQEMHWLRSNANLVAESRAKNGLKPEAEQWHERAKAFCDGVENIFTIFDKFFKIPNRAIAYELYPYVWDLKSIFILCKAYIRWLSLGHVPYLSVMHQQGTLTWCTSGYKEAFTSGDQEPWVFRGGLQAEFQHMLPIDGAHDLFFLKPPEPPVNKFYTIRPYVSADEPAIYEVCRRTCDDGMDGTDVFPGMPDLIGDRLVGGLLTINQEYCFVVEDEKGVCSYALAALDAKMFQQRSQNAWIPAMCEKYPKPVKDELTPADEVVLSFHNQPPCIPESVFQRYPSVIRMDILPGRICDPTIPYRLLAACLSALKTNGSIGVFCELNVGDKYLLEFYSRLGFFQFLNPDLGPEDTIYLGRIM